MRRTILVLLSVCLLFATASVDARPGFSGTYSVSGTNPGVGAYSGTLTITPHGDVYDVRWNIANLRYSGVGIVVNDSLSVAYSDHDHTFIGVATYWHSEGALEGRWAVSGGSRIGTETAVRR